MKFKGKVALVTGGSSGIGKAVALAFSREGAKVVVADIHMKGGEKTVLSIKKKGGQAIFIRTDVSKAKEVEILLKRIIQTYGRLDYALNNSGIGGIPSGVARCTEKNWDLVHQINLKGVWLCMKYEIPQMLKQKHGVIINTASIFGLIALKHHAAYVSSKHAVVGLTKTAALEYAPHGIRINAICPGAIATPLVGLVTKKLVAQHPIGRVGTPEEVAAAVIWLCSEEASFMIGSCVTMDGGRMLPH